MDVFAIAEQSCRALRHGSWMDGTIPQVVTMHDGKAEDLVVTPSSFQFPICPESRLASIT